MNKRILLFAAALTASASLFAQSKPVVTLRAGYVSASISGDANTSMQSLLDYTGGAISTTPHKGLFAGAGISIPVATGLTIEPGIGYAQKGYTMKGSLDLKGASFLSPGAKANLTLQYVDLPLLLTGHVKGLEVFGGPQLSYLAAAKFRTTAGALGINVFDKTMDAVDRFNRWDAGLTGGVGYRFANGLSVRGSYEHGLTKMDANRNIAAYNQAFKVGIGMSF
ncbi:MAG: hypothetical protein JWP27_857 [Flaviaesturariibacter sp.]|nr:hypothetical protein [Flaviaesturariibacter sp.]